MALNFILATLAFLSLGILLWQFVVAMRFPLHRRSADPGYAPPVLALKPLKGVDAETWYCLESWLKQNYAGPVKICFGVASAEDPAWEMARQLIAAHPERVAQLVICSESLGMNAKVSTLMQLFRQGVPKPTAGSAQEGIPAGPNRDEVILISDADVHVPPDLLANVVAPLRDERVGLVSCLYRLANPATLAMRWEAIAINADFWSQVLQAQSLKPLDFALGAVMAITRRRLESVGGFEALVDFLADDYQLGNRIARQSGRIALSPVVVECRESPKNWLDVWRHQLRWARTIRVCQPVPYFLSILGNATLWPLLWLIASIPSAAQTSYTTTLSGVTTLLVVQVHPLPKAIGVVLAICLARIVTAMFQESRLTRDHSHWAFFWLVPVKDMLAALVWGLSFLGNSVEWRGRRYRVRRGGKLEAVA